MKLERLREQLEIFHYYLDHLQPQMRGASVEACLKTIDQLRVVYEENQIQWTAVNHLFTGEQSLTQFLVGRIGMKAQYKREKTKFGILDFYTPLEKKEFSMPLEAAFLEQAQQFCVSNIDVQNNFYRRQCLNIGFFIEHFEQSKEKLQGLILKAQASKFPVKKYIEELSELNAVLIETLEELKASQVFFQRKKEAINIEKTLTDKTKEAQRFWDILEHIQKIQAYDELNFLQMYVARTEHREGVKSAPYFLDILVNCTPSSPKSPANISLPNTTNRYACVSASTSIDRLHTIFDQAIINYATQALFLAEICDAQSKSLEGMAFDTGPLMGQFHKWKEYFVNLNATLMNMHFAEKTQVLPILTVEVPEVRRRTSAVPVTIPARQDIGVPPPGFYADDDDTFDDDTLITFGSELKKKLGVLKVSAESGCIFPFTKDESPREATAFTETVSKKPQGNLVSDSIAIPSKPVIFGFAPVGSAADRWMKTPSDLVTPEGLSSGSLNGI